MTTSHKSLVAGLVLGLSIVGIASEAIAKSKRGFSSRSNSSNRSSSSNRSRMSNLHRNKSQSTHRYSKNSHSLRNNTTHRTNNKYNVATQKRGTMLKTNNTYNRNLTKTNKNYKKHTTTAAKVLTHKNTHNHAVKKLTHKPTILKKQHHKLHHNLHHKPHYPWAQRKQCFKKLDWCHYRPRHCHWWYDYCSPIRYAAPTECIRYVGSYVTCNATIGGVVVDDVRWRLGLKGILLPGKGLGIEAVEAGSPAEAAGLKPGMVVTIANNIQIADETAMPAAIEASGGVLKLTVLDQADGQAANVTIQMERLVAQNF